MSDKPTGLIITVDDLAAAHIGFQLGQRVLALLVDKSILTPKDAQSLLREMVAKNRHGGLGNQRAAQVLEEFAQGFDVPPKPKRH